MHSNEKQHEIYAFCNILALNLLKLQKFEGNSWSLWRLAFSCFFSFMPCMQGPSNTVHNSLYFMLITLTYKFRLHDVALV